MKATARIVLMAACLMLLATAPAMAVDCAAIQAACLDHCRTIARTPQQNIIVGTAQEKNCENRCSIASCQQTPLAARLCDATSQSICNNGFTACNDACIASTATTQAIIQSQASCQTACCNTFKLCLGQRQCELSTITVINCAAAGNQ